METVESSDHSTHRRESLVAACLVGTVVVILGYASGLGVSTKAAGGEEAVRPRTSDGAPPASSGNEPEHGAAPSGTAGGQAVAGAPADHNPHGVEPTAPHHPPAAAAPPPASPGGGPPPSTPCRELLGTVVDPLLSPPPPQSAQATTPPSLPVRLPSLPVSDVTASAGGAVDAALDPLLAVACTTPTPAPAPASDGP
jgi:hypothetical protein